MNIEDQVVSLELAKELKEAGYPQEGIWWWTQNSIIREDFYLQQHYLVNENLDIEVIVAPTVAELGEFMSRVDYTTRLKDDYGEVNGENLSGCWVYLYHGRISASAKTEADCRSCYRLRQRSGYY